MIEAARTLYRTPCLRRATVYARLSVPADLSLHLEWEDLPDRSQESDQGLRIAEELRIFGLIDHTVWVAREKNRGGQPSEQRLGALR